MSENRCRHACSKLQSALQEHQWHEVEAANVEGLQLVTTKIFRAYPQSKATAMFQRGSLPNLKNLESLEKAVSMLPKIRAMSNLLWLGALASIECTCRYSTHAEQIVESMMGFYQAIPDLSNHVTLVPNDSRFRGLVLEIFIEFVIFCNLVLKWASQKAIVGAIKGLFVPSPQHQAQTHITAMLSHGQALRRFPVSTSQQSDINVDSMNLETSDLTAVVSGKSHYLVPTRRDASFCGRDAILTEIHNSLLSPRTSANAEAQSVLIHGLSGIGKTSTALEYTYRYRESYDFVFWMVTSDPTIPATPPFRPPRLISLLPIQGLITLYFLNFYT